MVTRSRNRARRRGPPGRWRPLLSAIRCSYWYLGTPIPHAHRLSRSLPYFGSYGRFRAYASPIYPTPARLLHTIEIICELIQN